MIVHGKPTLNLPQITEEQVTTTKVGDKNYLDVNILGGGGGGGGGGEYVPQPWETLAISNGGAAVIPLNVNQYASYVKIKMYTKRTSTDELRIGYQEFFLVSVNALWEWHENYYKAIRTGWDGITFAVSTLPGGAPQRVYSANTMTGIYDPNNSTMRYQAEEVI